MYAVHTQRHSGLVLIIVVLSYVACVEISQNERRRKDDQVRATIMQKLVETGEKER